MSDFLPPEAFTREELLSGELLTPAAFPGGELVFRRPKTEVDPWPARKREFYRNHPRRCAICNASDVDLHHRHYRDPRGWENDATLVPLCKPHHRQVHRWHDHLAKQDELPYRWLSMVTTFAIVVLRSHLFARRPGVVAVGFTVAFWWAGWWFPVLCIAVMFSFHFIRKKPGD